MTWNWVMTWNWYEVMYSLYFFQFFQKAKDCRLHWNMVELAYTMVKLEIIQSCRSCPRCFRHFSGNSQKKTDYSCLPSHDKSGMNLCNVPKKCVDCYLWLPQHVGTSLEVFQRAGHCNSKDSSFVKSPHRCTSTSTYHIHISHTHQPISVSVYIRIDIGIHTNTYIEMHRERERERERNTICVTCLYSICICIWTYCNTSISTF